MKRPMHSSSETLPASRSEEAPYSQDVVPLDEKRAWRTPTLDRLNVDETEGALPGNADPFVS